MERKPCQRKMRYDAYTLILVKSYLKNLKSYFILDILSESNWVNLGIKAKAILCDLKVIDSTYF